MGYGRGSPDDGPSASITTVIRACGIESTVSIRDAIWEGHPVRIDLSGLSANNAHRVLRFAQGAALARGRRIRRRRPTLLDISGASPHEAEIEANAAALREVSRGEPLTFATFAEFFAALLGDHGASVDFAEISDVLLSVSPFLDDLFDLAAGAMGTSEVGDVCLYGVTLGAWRADDFRPSPD